MATTANHFGAMWTAEKLQVLQNYLAFYCSALKHQRFQLAYIDAFAGTGRCRIKTGADRHRLIDGSAKIALDRDPGFDAYRFIERKRAHQIELEALIASHPNGPRARIAKGTCQAMLPEILDSFDWAQWRGVMFLDPFGLQVTWQMLEHIESTKALDVFFLVSLSGLFRQAAISESRIDEGKANRLTAFLGTDGWRDALYTREQMDLFLGPQRTRDPGWEDILAFTTARLRTLFAHVEEPGLMSMQNGTPLFALYFAVSNPSKAALSLASKVGQDVLRKLPR